MPEELDVGRVVAHIEIDNNAAESEAEVKKTLNDIADKVKQTKPQLDMQTNAEEFEKKTIESLEKVKSKIKSGLGMADIQGLQELNELMSKSANANTSVQVEFDIKKEDVIEQVLNVLREIGIEGQEAQAILDRCFADTSGIKKYTDELKILGVKIEEQRLLIKQLEEAAAPKSYKSTASIVSAVKELTKAEDELRKLEKQYDATYASQDKYVKKQANLYQKQTADAEKAVQKQEQLNQKMETKTSRADLSLGMMDLSNSLRSFNAVAPGAIDNIGTIVRQVNMAKRAMTSAASGPMQWATGIIAAATIIATIATNYFTELKRKEEEAREKAAQLAEEYADNTTQIQALVQEYEILKQKLTATNQTHAEEMSAKEQLISIQEHLIEMYGEEANGIDLINENLDSQIEKVKELAIEDAKKYQQNNRNEYKTAKEELAKKKEYKVIPDSVYSAYAADYLEKNGINVKNPLRGLVLSAEEAEEKLREVDNLLEKFKEDNKDNPEIYMESIMNLSSENIKSATSEQIDQWKKIVEAYENAQKTIESGGESVIPEQDWEKTYTNIRSNISAIESLSSAYDKLSSGQLLSSDDLTNLCEQHEKIADYIVKTGDLTLQNGELAKQVNKEALESNIKLLESEQETLEAKKDRTDDENAQLKKTSAALEIYKNKLEEVSNVDTSADLSTLKSEMDSLGSAYNTLSQNKSLDLNTTLNLIEQYPEFAAALATGTASLEEQENAVKTLFEAKKEEAQLSLREDREKLNSLISSTSKTIQLIELQRKAYEQDGGEKGIYADQYDEASKNIETYKSQLEQIEAKITAIDNLSIDTYAKENTKNATQTNEALQEQLNLLEHRKALNQLSYAEEIAWLQELYNRYAANASERMSLEEKIYNAQKSYQQEIEKANSDILSTELKNIDHLANMEQLTNEQQLAWLQTLYSQYVMTAEERMSLEEKIYNLQKNIREEQTKAVKEALNEELDLLEHRKSLNQLSAREELEWLERINSQYAMDVDDKRKMEVKLYNAKKELQEAEEKAIEDKYNTVIKNIETAREMNKISGEQELEMLLRIRNTYKRNAEQEIELQKKIRNLRREIYNDRSSELDNIGSAVVEALRNKYEEQKKLEEQRINESIESWQKWEDETVDAIQGQIDAIDELAKAQENENERQEYEQKRQATALQLAYEKDDYNRKQLQKELNRLDSEESKRLADEERERQKKALQEQMDQVKEQSSQQQQLLQDQLDAMSENYEQLMSNSSLNTQAYEYMVKSSQHEIVQLIASYAPEYEGLGKTLGGKLYEGMRSSITNFDWWTNNFDVMMQYYQRQAEITANQAADNFWATRAEYEKSISAQNAANAAPTVSMIVNFNEPVESPIQVQRKMSEVTQQIAAQLQR